MVKIYNSTWTKHPPWPQCFLYQSSQLTIRVVDPSYRLFPPPRGFLTTTSFILIFWSKSNSWFDCWILSMTLNIFSAHIVPAGVNGTSTRLSRLMWLISTPSPSSRSTCASCRCKTLSRICRKFSRRILSTCRNCKFSVKASVRLAKLENR